MSSALILPALPLVSYTLSLESYTLSVMGVQNPAGCGWRNTHSIAFISKKFQLTNGGQDAHLKMYSNNSCRDS